MLEELSALVAEYAATNPYYARYNMDAAYVTKAIGALGGAFKSVVAMASTGEMVGFVVGVLAELIMCPGELTLSEVAWYVRPECRRVGVGRCLRQGFCLFGQMNGAAQVVVSLAKSSEVPYSSMEGDGFVPLSTSFILRVPCVSPLLPQQPLVQSPGQLVLASR